MSERICSFISLGMDTNKREPPHSLLNLHKYEYLRNFFLNSFYMKSGQRLERKFYYWFLALLYHGSVVYRRKYSTIITSVKFNILGLINL